LLRVLLCPWRLWAGVRLCFACALWAFVPPRIAFLRILGLAAAPLSWIGAPPGCCRVALLSGLSAYGWDTLCVNNASLMGLHRHSLCLGVGAVACHLSRPTQRACSRPGFPCSNLGASCGCTYSLCGAGLALCVSVGLHRLAARLSGPLRCTWGLIRSGSLGALRQVHSFACHGLAASGVPMCGCVPRVSSWKPAPGALLRLCSASLTWPCTVWPLALAEPA